MLKTVRVPTDFTASFERAEELVSNYFSERRDDPTRGTIEIQGQRYVLVRAASLSVEFFALVRQLYGPGRGEEADLFARNILYDLAHAIGRSDARTFHTKIGLKEPVARLSAGPVHFAHAGWALVEILPESHPVPSEDFKIFYDHPYAFESDAWTRAGQTSDFPVCIMNAGYSSGWCEESFGIELVASEILCRAKGDPACRFVMAPPSRIEAVIAGFTGGARLADSYQIPDFFVRKRVEEELRQSREDLERRVAERTRELREANDRLRREMEERRLVEERLRSTMKLEAVGRLAGGIAHDFNNILGVILHRAMLAGRALDGDSPLREELDEIAEAARRAASLTRNLLAFSRGQVLAREHLELDAQVRNVARLLRPLIGDDVTLATELDARGGHILADRGQIEQVVTNLVMNARDAMPSGGTLRLETRAVTLDAPDATGRAPGEWLTLTVTDTGVGMDAATLARIFEPFFTTKADGTGLGLSTVYGVVTNGGGHVAVESEPGAGSRFVLSFPRVAPAAPRASAVPVERASSPGVERVLLVEDQANLRASIRLILTHSGYAVHEATDGEHALELAQAHSDIDIVITDVVMPRMNGRDLAARLRADRPDLPVIFMSGYAENFSLDEGSPRAVCLPKPFDPEMLLEHVRSLLDAR